MTLTFLQLFWTFFTIGLVNFGGGAAMLSLIQGKVVSEYSWISQAQFTDIVAIAQTTPGPIGINCATYVGYEVGANLGGTLLGILGSALATFALVLPAFIVFWGIVRLYKKYHTKSIYSNIMEGLRPVVAGLIIVAAIILMFDFTSGSFSILHDNFPDYKSWIIMLAGVVASLFFKVNPLLLIVCGGILGLIFY